MQAPTTFRYQIEALTPQVIGVSPTSGPNEGGTVVSIIGSGFQSPVKVFFVAGDVQVEAAVQQVTFNQIIAVTPKASGLGAELANQQVAVRVVNTLTGKDVISGTPLFRYGPSMKITGFTPGSASAGGGDKITIFGWGFDDPVVITTASGPMLAPLKVSGTEIVALVPPADDACGGGPVGAVTVTNLEDGTFATSAQALNLIALDPPIIVGIAPSTTTPGSNVNLSVENAGSGAVSIAFTGEGLAGTVTRTLSGGSPVAGDRTIYSVSVPSNIVFPVQPCGAGGTGEQNRSVDLTATFTNLTNSCETQNEITVTVNPLDTTCRLPALAAVSPSTIAFGDQGEAAGATAPRQITVSNAGGGTLTVLGASSDDPQFTVIGTFPSSLTAGQSTNLTTTFDPASVGPHSGKITIATSEGDVTVAVSGNRI